MPIDLDDDDTTPTENATVLRDLAATLAAFPLGVVEWGAATSPGTRRRVNEDTWGRRDDVFVVADGMGGRGGGALAARTAVDRLLDRVGAGDAHPDWRAIIERVNAEVIAVAAERGIERVGTTLLAAAVGGPVVTLVHLGDSRAYRLTHLADDGRLDLLTHDHNVRAELLAAGLDVRDYRERGVALHGLTSFIGLEHDVLRVDVLAVPVRSGDRILLCTDGVHRQLDDDRLRALLGAPTTRLAAEALVREADVVGGRDNATAVVVQVGTVEVATACSAPTATLRLAPGSGLVCRRGSALLFVTAPDRALVDAFATSDEGAELQMLASATVAAGFDVPPYVGLTWGGGLRVMAFGDIAVETDQPSLPMLSGAGSRTWVEHTLALGGRGVVEVAGGAADEATDLGAGTVAAGGFRLELGAPAVSDVVAEDPTPVPTSVPTSEAVGADETAAVPRTTPEGEPPPAAEASPTAEAPPAAVDSDDPAAALAAIQAAAVGADGEPVQPAGVAPAVPAPAPDPEWSGGDEPHDADITLPPPVSEVLLADVRSPDTTDGRGSLVDAKLCTDGHANPPTAATCAVCGDFLAPGTGAVVHVPRPSLGRLQLDDGELIELDQELLIGRNPDRDDEPSRARLRRVKALGDKVSRSHLEVRFQGWDVLVDDLGSTNGTFVVAHPGGQVMPLEPGRAQMVEPGAVVYFGSRSLTVLGRHDDG